MGNNTKVRNKKNESENIIQVQSFNEDANKAVNKAITYWRKYHTPKIDTSQLFIAMIEGAENREDILGMLNTSFENLVNSYEDIISKNNKAWEKDSDAPEFDVDNFSSEVCDLFNMVSYFAYDDEATINCGFVIRIMLEHLNNDTELSNMLHNAGVDIDKVSDIIEAQKVEQKQKHKFEIPKGFEDTVVDLNTSKQVLESKIKYNEEYTSEIIEVLSRKVKANPVLIGQPGVGKTTAVYGLVQKIISGDVPEQLKDKHIMYINSTTISAGAMYAGAFQQFMKGLIQWAQESGAILFFDEIHALINSGKTSSDSAETGGNILKNAMADGSIKIIGATTLKEYHKFIEVDAGFARRIQEIEVKEPTAEETIDMINTTISEYEEYHNVSVSSDAIEAAVRLSDRYMKDRFLPDKAYTILDQACAKAKINNNTNVDEKLVSEVVSKITGVDVKKLSGNEAKALLKIENVIEKQVIGQSNAVHRVCRAIRRAKAGTREHNKPIATFLFVGPTGVGKTELCKVLSEEITPGRENFIKIDMSEYSEKHSVAKFIGSPPGYVGYGEGGQLTEKVKHNPYSVVLFDEIEKAHPEVFNIFLQLLDEGKMTDGSGQIVDFTNCIVIMTSNAGYGADELSKRNLGFGVSDSTSIFDEDDEKDKKVRLALESTFRPEFLNRLDDIIIFDKLNKEHTKAIVKLMLKKLSDRVNENRQVKIKFTSSVVDMLSEVGYSDKYGARNLKRKIQDLIEDELSIYLLDGTFKNGVEYSIGYNNKVKEITVKPVKDKDSAK